MSGIEISPRSEQYLVVCYTHAEDEAIPFSRSVMARGMCA